MKHNRKSQEQKRNSTTEKQEYSHKESTNRHVYIEPGVQIDFVTDFKQEYKSTQQEAASHNKRILFWQKVSTVLISVYAIITAVQAYYTRQSVNVASDTLTVSQGANIYTGTPTIQYTEGTTTLYIPLTNGGHIPSGPLEFVAHQLLQERQPVIPPVIRIPNSPMFRTARYSWHRYRQEANPPGSTNTFHIPINEAIKDRVETGYQGFVVAGRISYGDGFPHDQIKTWPVCIKTIYLITEKEINLEPCNSEEFIPKMEKLDGYPSNEDKE
jgi:hypothetical protein